jgi:methylthioribose-1-phosphate isomerase
MLSHEKTGEPACSLWIAGDNHSLVEVIDQRLLPFRLEVFRIQSLEDAFYAIREMVVRGAPLIGVTAAFGMYFAFRKSKNSSLDILLRAADYLCSSRPTAVNLSSATGRMIRVFNPGRNLDDNLNGLFREACQIRQEEIDSCLMIGKAGLPLLQKMWEKKGRETVHILTHCNAGWLACIRYGTATAPIYLAHEKGIPLHVWVDETRPRNQGARLTAFELGQAGIPHTIIPDNAGGHLMQKGMVDLVIVGSDRTSIYGDVANKTGTYLKALAAHDNNIPFYVALPSSSIDWNPDTGMSQIPIEERSPDEVLFTEGWDGEKITKIRVAPENSHAANYGFDVTPARFVTGLVTERGICKASREGLEKLYPEKFILSR